MIAFGDWSNQKSALAAQEVSTNATIRFDSSTASAAPELSHFRWRIGQRFRPTGSRFVIGDSSAVCPQY